MPASARLRGHGGRDIGRGDERKLATVLFADLVGSTALADDEDPERVRVRLDRFYAAMAEPFALRALGAARSDDAYLARAQERFAELALGWHAAQTERLLALSSRQYSSCARRSCRSSASSINRSSSSAYGIPDASKSFA